MKKLLIILSVFIFVTNIYSQSDKYIVLKVKGKILLKKNNKEIKPQDQILSEDQIIFATPDAVAALHSPQKGRFTLRAQSTDNKTKGGFLALVKNSLTPASERLSSKRAKTKSFEETLDTTFYLITTAKYKLTDEYTVDDKNYFQFKTLDKKPKTIKLNVEDGYLVINKKDVMSGKTKLVKLNLFYKTADDEKLIKEITIISVDKNSFKKDINTYVKVLQDDGYDNKKIKDAVLAYINDMYGKFNDFELSIWLKTNFNF